MRIYIAGLMEVAARTPVGGKWVLSLEKVKSDLGITDDEFDELQRQIELQVGGFWDKASSPNNQVYVYRRLA